MGPGGMSLCQAEKWKHTENQVVVPLRSANGTGEGGDSQLSSVTYSGLAEALNYHQQQ